MAKKKRPTKKTTRKKSSRKEDVDREMIPFMSDNQLLTQTLDFLGEEVFITSDSLDWSDSKILFANRAFYQTSSYSQSEVIGNTPRMLLGERGEMQKNHEIQSDLDEKGQCLTQIIGQRKDGTSYEAELKIITLSDEAGQRTHYVAIHRDVSDQKQSELELRGSEKRFRTLFNKSLDAILVADDDGRYVMVNDAACKLLGYSREKLLTMQVSDLQTQTEPDAEQRYQNYLKRGQDVGEFRFIAPNGEARVAEYAAVRLGPNRHLSILRDVTERRSIENALEKSEEQIRTILNAAADAIITIDQQGNIRGANPATIRMFGYSENELIGQNVKILMPKPYSDEHDEYLKRYLETGEARIIGIGREVEGKRKDGTLFPIDLSVSEVDHLGLYTGIVRDITERRSIQDQLIQSERLSALGEAMAGLAHESRNALGRSNANLNQLRRRLTGKGDLLGLIERALQANSDIQRQFEEVREFAAPIKPRVKPVDVPSVIQKAWEELADEQFLSMSSLNITPTNFAEYFEADPQLLRDVFRNMMENSLSACEGTCKLSVTLSKIVRNKVPTVLISFHDNGPGMSAEAKEHAFDSFYTTKTRGTGLGLSIVKRIIEAHGGQVEIGNDDQPGTEILIALPQRK